ncbi:MAG: FUSC family protein [Cyanobacteriota bacterium]|jgi:hypothetical protein
MPLITRPELRLALTTGLVNGLASLSPIPFGYYAPMAVLAVGSDTYGNTLEMGRQRIFGSILGMVVLTISRPGLGGMPLPLALGLALGAMRWIGGTLGLRVGYKVGGMIVVMGWLAHGEQLDAWVPLRLLWTILGIVAGLLSLALFWPSRGEARGLAVLAELFAALAEDLEGEASRAAAPAGPARTAFRTATAGQERQAALQNLRGLLPTVASELGDRPLRHPAFRLLETLEDAASRLVGASLTLAGLPVPQAPELAQLQAGEADLLQGLADRLRLWCQSLEGRGDGSLPAPPTPPLTPPPSWLAIDGHLHHPALNQLPPRQLERLAARQTLCRQALDAVAAAERAWTALRHGPGEAREPRPSSRLGGDGIPTAG